MLLGKLSSSCTLN